jgi:hypothetical protein
MKRFLPILLIPCLAAISNAQVRRPAAKVTFTAEQIMDRGAAALGPKEAWDKITTSVMEGAVTVKGTDLSGTITVTAKRPNRFLVKQTIKGVGVVLQGYDGKVGWTKDPKQGVRKLTGAELAAAKRAALFDAHLQWRKLYKKWQLVGVRKVNGRDAYVIRLSPQLGRATIEYHDTKTFQLVRTDMVTETAAGPLPIEVYPSDYRKVSGVLIPFTVRQVQRHPDGPAMDVLIRIRTVKTNVPVPDSVFAMPKS